MARSNIYVRVDEETKVYVQLLVAEIFSETAQKVTENEAVKRLFTEHRPDLAGKAKRLLEEQKSSE